MTTWKRFSDELPPEGATVEWFSNGKLSLSINWYPEATTVPDRLKNDWWRIWEPPPKPVSAREKAWNSLWNHRPTACGTTYFDSGWIEACKHIEEKIRLRVSDCDLGNSWIDACAKIAKEAQE